MNEHCCPMVVKRFPPPPPPNESLAFETLWQHKSLKAEMDGKGTRRTETSRVVCHERARGVLLPNFDSKKHVCPNDSAPLSVYTIARAPALVSRTSQSSGGIGRIEMGGGGEGLEGLWEKRNRKWQQQSCAL